jgi:pyrroloquinoline quinone biosynthesis protein D
VTQGAPGAALDLEARPRLAPGVRLKYDEARSCWVVLAPERVLMPDDTALEVLQRLDGKKTVDDLVGELVTAYDADRGEILADVTELLNGLLEKRVLAL